MITSGVCSPVTGEPYSTTHISAKRYGTKHTTIFWKSGSHLHMPVGFLGETAQQIRRPHTCSGITISNELMYGRNQTLIIVGGKYQ
jgi:hypothetical protein